MEKETTPNKKSQPRGSTSGSEGKKPIDTGKTSKSSTGARAVEGVKGKATKSVPAKMNSGASVTSKSQPIDVSEKSQAPASAASPMSNANEVKSTAGAALPRTPASPASARSPEVKANDPARPKSISAEERYRLIAEAAYYRAEKRGFQGGDPAQDWIQAEKEVDAKFSKPN